MGSEENESLRRLNIYFWGWRNGRVVKKALNFQRSDKCCPRIDSASRCWRFLDAPIGALVFYFLALHSYTYQFNAELSNWKCNFPLNDHARLSVGSSVINSTKGRKSHFHARVKALVLLQTWEMGCCHLAWGCLDPQSLILVAQRLVLLLHLLHLAWHIHICSYFCRRKLKHLKVDREERLSLSQGSLYRMSYDRSIECNLPPIRKLWQIDQKINRNTSQQTNRWPCGLKGKLHFLPKLNASEWKPMNSFLPVRENHEFIHYLILNYEVLHYLFLKTMNCFITGSWKLYIASLPVLENYRLLHYLILKTINCFITCSWKL